MDGTALLFVPAPQTAYDDSRPVERVFIQSPPQAVDEATGASIVRVDRTTRDTSDFKMQYNPSHPAANADGYVMLPNVNPLIEMTDMREAQRAYEANLNVVDAARNMMARTLDLLRRG